jgi:hypothetical protein
MSRRRDRERFRERKHLNPDYSGFRGYDREPDKPGQTPMQTVACSVCGRKRNVPAGVAQEQGSAYVCLSCQQDKATEKPAES